MGTTTSKPVTPDGGAQNATNTSPTQTAPGGQTPPAEAAATCPLGFDKKKETKQQRTEDDASSSTTTKKGCPVKKKDNNNAEAAASSAVTAAAADGGGAATCPVKGSERQVAKYLHPHRFNVYSQRVDGGGGGSAAAPTAAAVSGGTTMDPSNNMPSNPNQQPAPGQREALSTERVSSTIPKGGEENTWTYPSPQMFWNALSRKGKAEDTEEGDMAVVVSIHNNMNEITWKKILQWERLRTGIWEDGAEPRLLRFLGRPDDTTPKALAKMMIGHPLPFDRHDWVVDRGGDERRYVIDYYHDEGVADGDEVPDLHDEEAVKSIKVDVRPALDGFRDFADRLVQMPLARLTGKSDFVPLPLRPSPTMERREPRAKLRPGRTPPAPRGGGGSGKEAVAVAPAPAPANGNGQAAAGGGTTREGRAMARMQKKCAPRLKALRAAEEGDYDEARAKAAALRLEYCTARYLCKKEAREYKEAVAFLEVATRAGNEYWAAIAVDRKLSDMRAALARFTQRQVEARGGGSRRGGRGGGGEGEGEGERGH